MLVRARYGRRSCLSRISRPSSRRTRWMFTWPAFATQQHVNPSVTVAQSASRGSPECVFSTAPARGGETDSDTSRAVPVPPDSLS